MILYSGWIFFDGAFRALRARMLDMMRRNLGWAIGHNAVALPHRCRGVRTEPGLTLRPEIAAISMSGSSFIVAVNELPLKRLRLPRAEGPPAVETTEEPVPGVVS